MKELKDETQKAMITRLEDFKAYNLAMEVGEEVWGVVKSWSYFEKDTINKQLVKAADSIAANLSEGLGRYHYKEVKNFSYYSRGSLFETKTWLTKSNNRELISKQNFDSILERIESLNRMINAFINSTGQVNEPEIEYRTGTESPNP